VAPPVEKSELVQEEAFVEVHESCEPLPLYIWEGVAVRSAETGLSVTENAVQAPQSLPVFDSVIG
jgi:hypothetical protein